MMPGQEKTIDEEIFWPRLRGATSRCSPAGFRMASILCTCGRRREDRQIALGVAALRHSSRIAVKLRLSPAACLAVISVDDNSLLGWFKLTV